MPSFPSLPPLTVVLLVDGLSPRYLGPYGCTWIDTPSLNRLAAHSIVFENAVADSIDADWAIRSVITGTPAANFGSADLAVASPLGDLRDQAHCLLMSDDPASWHLASPNAIFDEVIDLPNVRERSSEAGPASHLADTHLAHCFAWINTVLLSRDLPLVAVVHLASIAQLWDAPPAMRARFCEEDDPDPGDWVVPPGHLANPQEPDPDEILGITRALAAQIECFDICLGTLLEELELQQLGPSTLLALAGLRGFPTGHHGVVGPGRQHLYSDVIDIPCWIKLPETEPAVGWRDHQLIQPSSILSLLVKGFTEQPDRPEPIAARRAAAAVLTAGDHSAIRTPAWLLVESPQQQRLFVKPDDHWDVNPVQDRCRHICDALGLARQQFLESLADARTRPMPPLTPELVERWD